MKKYQVKHYYSIFQFGNVLKIGNMPPIALEISEAPSFLKDIILFFSHPHSIYEAKKFFNNNFGLNESIIENTINKLIEYKVISEPVIDLTNRYSRHELYYDLINSDVAHSQNTLSNKKVGLVGVGGIGSNIGMILAGAGIGNLVLLDHDVIEESNLTRQYLYHESHIGMLKSEVAKTQLLKLNSNIKITEINRQVVDENDFDLYFHDCDIVILSADTPSEIHQWINNSSIRNNFAYSNAGYIDSFGIVGPLVIPRKTSCYECFKHLTTHLRYSSNQDEVDNQLNLSFQSPSFGPLNSLVSSIQANEVIRYLLGLKNETENNRLLIDSETYIIHKNYLERNKDCTACNI
jgi:molybdopterin/thiamine biosynthesis adenylyltransferase